MSLLRSNGFSCLQSKKKWLTHEESEEFYAIHKGKHLDYMQFFIMMRNFQETKEYSLIIWKLCGPKQVK